MARSKKSPAPDVDEALAAAASAVEQVHLGDDGPSRAIAEMKEDTWDWKVRKLLQAPFDPRNIRWTTPDGKSPMCLHVHPYAAIERLEAVFGIDGFSVDQSYPTVTRITFKGEDGKCACRDGGAMGFANPYEQLCEALQLLGIGRYLRTVDRAEWIKGNIPQSAVPRVRDRDETIYPFHHDSVAAAATEPAKAPAPDLPLPPKATKLTQPPPEPAKTPEPEKPKPPTLEGELARWEQMIRMMDVSGFNEMLKLKFGTLPAEFKPKVWAMLQGIAKDDMGWLYDKENKEFFVPDGDGTEDAVPW